MKKIVLFITLLFIPLFIYADMGAPAIETYKATVTNKDGAKLYEYNSDKDKYVATGKVVKYNTTVKVLWEEGTYLAIDGYDDVISSKDVTPTKDYKLDEKKLSEKETSIVLKDTDIKKGPSEGYKSTGKTIKKGETITVRAIEKEEANPWYYVTYDGVSGYINSYGGHFTVVNYGVKEFINVDEVKLLDPDTKEVVATIPASTKMKTKLYSLDMWSRKYYFEYNGVKGVTSENDIIIKGKPIEFTLKAKMNLYEGVQEQKIYDKKLKPIKTLSKGTVFSSEYYGTYMIAQIYYEKDGVVGWLAEEQNDEGDFKSLKFELPDDEEEETITTEEPEVTEPETNEPEVINEQNPNENINLDTIEEKTTSSRYHTLYLCIAVAVIACITTVVTMSLINKKRGK